MKEKLRSLGVSIYVKAGPRTKDFHEILDILENQKGVKIPEHANLEMIHDLRNNIQHRGAAVLKSETDFYIKTTSDFMKRFLKDQLNWELRDIVHAQYYKLLELDIIKATQPIKITSQGAIKLYKIEEAPSVMLLEYRNIETELDRIAKKLLLQQKLPEKHRPLTTSDIVDILISNGTLPKETKDDFDTISRLRNKVAHMQKEVTMEEFEMFILSMIRFKGRVEMLG